MNKYSCTGTKARREMLRKRMDKMLEDDIRRRKYERMAERDSQFAELYAEYMMLNENDGN